MHTYSNLSTKIQILQTSIAWQLHSLSLCQNKGIRNIFWWLEKIRAAHQYNKLFIS